MRGEVVFDAGGQRYTLFLGTAAQCAIEEQYDLGFFAVVTDALPNIEPHVALNPEAYPGEVLAATRQLRIATLRDLAWHGLQRHHPGIDIPVVNDIIDELGPSAFGEVIGKAIFAARDVGSSDKGAGGKAAPGKSPTRARGRTGTPSRKSGQKPGLTP